ncbi:DNA polymerase III [Azospirillum doebereinerae]|uniref:DNA polymerase III n=1 Tax=Azospirillum doebereinerae TaxID=92933 RepID=UPI001EE50143|nr:DNA polymerase III [Azospirillum doebereinerae]MCG5242755.1 DNA polymerase III [Azospirillum doebereinerae]
MPTSNRDNARNAAERVALHCEATSYDAATAEPLRIVALRIRGNRVLAGGALDLCPGVDGTPAEIAERLRRFLGDRPLVGYIVEFSAALVERLIGAPLRNERVEVSSLYYARKVRTVSKSAIDLRLDSLIRDLDLPVRAEDAHGAALAVAMAWLRLTQDER